MGLMRDTCLDYRYYGGLLKYDFDISSIDFLQIEDENYLGYYPKVFKYNEPQLLNVFLGEELKELVFSEVWDLGIVKTLTLYFKDSMPDEEIIQASIVNAFSKLAKLHSRLVEGQTDIDDDDFFEGDDF